jgi:hypothetical protein
MPMTGHYVFLCLCADLDITYGRGERQVILVTGMSSAPCRFGADDDQLSVAYVRVQIV